jgi:3D-(3,5/4)-trihydroxycyclohexane-1,2-dione acylhydrolase (decyclizing)
MPTIPAFSAAALFADWDRRPDRHQTPTIAPNPTHAQVVSVRKHGSWRDGHPDRRCRGIPGEVAKGWRISDRQNPLHVDSSARAAAMGAASRHVESLAVLGAALDWAKGNAGTTVLGNLTDAHAWVPGHADWDVGVPEVSDKGSVAKARSHQVEISAKQRVGV